MDIVPGHYSSIVFGEGFKPTFVKVGVNEDGDVCFEVDYCSKFQVDSFAVFCTHAPYVSTGE